MAHQGWYFFPILLLEGLSLHVDGDPPRHQSGPRFSVAGSRSASSPSGSAGWSLLWCSSSCRPEKAVAFLAVQLAVFGLYMGSSFAPNHIGMPLVSPKLKLDFLRRQVLMSRNISGGPPISIFMGGLNYQIEHHLFPSMAATAPTQSAAARRRLLRRPRRPLHPHHALAVLPHRHRLPQHRRTKRQRPLPVPPGRSTPSPLTRHIARLGQRLLAVTALTFKRLIRGKQQQESEENRCNSDERLKSRHHRERTVRYVKLSCSCASPTG